ncbi:MAG: NADH-quinone oxidoreductase subunit N [Planctomycetaceae bacterium]
MSVTSILDTLIQHELPRSLQIFTPELFLCGTVVVMLLVRVFNLGEKIPAQWVALFGALIVFLAVFTQFVAVAREQGMLPVSVAVDDGAAAKVAYSEGAQFNSLYKLFRVRANGVGLTGETYFSGMLMHDEFATMFRLGLALFLVLVVALTVLTGIPDLDDGADFYSLLMGATLGMMLACGAHHLLMLFIAVEMMSVPSYAMVGFLKGRKTSSEAAFKYVVYGAGAAGVMLYGVSLLAGLLGTGDFAQLGERFAFLMEGERFALTNATAVTVVLGVMMVVVGLAFKLSLVPFHFWCPDVFEGAAAEVGGFLSVASKAGAFALLVRFVLAFTGDAAVLREASLFFGLALGFVACFSMTLGNLAAYTQSNIKRMLAYSTIAHAGYMVLAVSALLVFSSVEAGSPVAAELTRLSALRGGGVDAASARAIEGLIYYLAVYLFMNLTAFAVIALLRNQTYREDIDAYKGLFQSNTTTRVLCICLAISFFSLVGLPPFGGFFAKLMIFMSVFAAGKVHWLMWVFVGVAGLNTVFSLFYYLNVLRTMFISSPEPGQPKVSMPGLVGGYVLLITLPILALGMPIIPHEKFMIQESLSSTANQVAEQLLSE